MTLQMIGCTHHEAAVSIREQLSFTERQSQQVFDLLAQRFPGAEMVLLSTCNRVELYVATASPPTPNSSTTVTADDLRGLVAEVLGLSPAFVADHMTVRRDREVVEHLFLVATSLDSMIVGEAQILSQVKQAYEFANAADATGPVTHAAFQAANRAAKRVQSETTIHRRRLSVPSVAIGEVVPEVFDTLRGKRVVVCGAGEMAEETLRYLKDGGSDDLCVINRSYERAVALGKAFGAEVERFDSLPERIIEADLLIGTTSAEEPLIDAATFAELNDRRGGRILLILDLAVPRDFHPVIGQQTGVYLYQIDDLEAVCHRNRRERERQWPKAKRIIDEEVQKFVQDLNQRAAGPVIRRLRSRAEKVKTEELERLMGKLNGSADAATAKEIEKAFDRLTNKLLHPPMASLRDDAATGHSRGLLEALRDLFNLGEDA